jgi:hypothetical protein
MNDALVHALLAERFGKPVRQYKPTNTPAPCAELLDVLKHMDDNEDSPLTVVREVG